MLFFDNILSANSKILTDNNRGANMVSLYTCDFTQQNEWLDDIDEETNDHPAPIGEFLCRILSIDFEKAASSISSLLESHRLNGDEFPEEQLKTFIDDLLGISGFEEMRVMIAVLKNIYAKSRTRMVLNIYGTPKDAFFSEAFDYFRVVMVLQAYLEVSIDNNDMVSAINFERFVNGFLEEKIGRNDQGCSLSEYSFSDIYPGCNIKEIIKDVSQNILQFHDTFSSFSTYSLNNLLVSAIYYFFLNGFRFKRCKNCGNFFVPLSRSDEIYCNNISPQDKTRTCKEYGSQKLWYDKLRADEVAKLSRNVYSSKQMLVRRNPDISEYRRMFEYFKAERKKWEAWVKSGEKSKEEYISWLNEMKAKKTL